MRKGLMIGATEGPDTSLDSIVRSAKDAEEKGFDHLWMANIFGFDAISTLSIIGRETNTIGLGTAVTPTYPRHPSAIAQQALTAAAASNGRFKLGIGLSHKIVIEDMLGFSYDKPARHMREYLHVLAPLLRGETVSYEGTQYNVNNVALQVPGSGEVPLLVAALGPVMLKLTGEMADGTITWMTGPNTLESHIVPTLTRAAKSAGRASPLVAAGFPIVLTNDPDEARAKVARMLEVYGMLPSYRAMLDKEGVAGPADIALIGDEKSLLEDLKRIQETGVTDFCAAIVTDDKETQLRTLEFLAQV
ncbi:MAG: LLM class F420-dependent oxidoreductase [Pseudomonadales bacterium]